MSAPLDHDLPLSATSASGCACCVPDNESGSQAGRRPEQWPEQSARTEYRVAGMTCGHCASSVTEALSALTGVSDVQIALVPGGISTVTIAAARRLGDAEVQSAVTEAGYELISS